MPDQNQNEAFPYEAEDGEDDVLVLHPGPMNRGIEIEPDTCYSEFSSIQEQVKNGVSVRMAVLYLTIMGGDDVDTTR